MLCGAWPDVIFVFTPSLPGSWLAPYLPDIDPVQSFDMFSFMNQDNNKLDPFLHELLLSVNRAAVHRSDRRRSLSCNL
eukprot:155366-Pelagomonas_calceolata.AAC.1